MDTVLHSFGYCLDFIREQVDDVSAPQMVLQPDGNPNHPAWLLGHLSFSCQSFGGEIGLAPWLSKGWGKRFGMGSTPVADESAYDPKEKALETLLNSQTRLCDAINSLSNAELQRPLPDKNYEKDLPTTAHAMVQVLVAHSAYHVGQLTLWRRAVGLAKLERPFL